MPEQTLHIVLENEDVIAVYKASVVKPKEKRQHERSITLSCLRDLLSDDRVELQKEKSGAPFLPNHDWNISLSHSGPWYAFHLAKKNNAGIDIQVMRKRSLKEASSYFVSQREKELELNELNLHIIWCAKEAVYKYTKGTLKDDRESAIVTHIGKDTITMNFEGEEINCKYKVIEDYILVFMHN